MTAGYCSSTTGQGAEVNIVFERPDAPVGSAANQPNQRNATMTWASPAMDDEEFAAMTAIEPGIPPYMRRHVNNWIIQALGGYPLNEDISTDLALMLKIKISESYREWELMLDSAADGRIVTILDWLLYHSATARYGSDRLKEILDNGRSEWTVSLLESGRPRIAKRIPEGVQAALQETVSRTGAAGSLLARAFNSIYGATPNPNHAYDMCVKSVETVACPLFLPSSPRATLGSVSSHLNQKSVTLPLREAGAPDKDLIVSMMRKLFLGAERHGSENYADVSMDGAKAALSLATALLSMLHEDVITVS